MGRVGSTSPCRSPYWRNSRSSHPNQWRYVPTQFNPADFGTRGLTAHELSKSTKWWNGPEFLTYPEAEWPACKFDKPSGDALKELKVTPKQKNEDSQSFNAIQCTTSRNDEASGGATDDGWRLDTSRYSK